MVCWHCGRESDGEKIFFRTVCEFCLADQHCCRNCRQYRKGLPNDCNIPGTEPVADREKGNFCEEFLVSGIFSPSSSEGKKKFDDLFRS